MQKWSVWFFQLTWYVTKMDHKVQKERNVEWIQREHRYDVRINAYLLGPPDVQIYPDEVSLLL